MQNGALRGSHFLGDSGYATTNWLLCPYRKTRGRGQEKYNSKLTRGRVVIERTFGIMKAKWRLLQNKCRLSPRIFIFYMYLLIITLDKLSGIAMVCAMLHNISLINGIIDNEEWNEVESIEEIIPSADEIREINQQIDGLNYRNDYVVRFFE